MIVAAHDPRIIAAALEVTTLVAGGADLPSVAQCAARHVCRLSRCATVAVYLHTGSAALGLLATAGRPAETLRRNWPLQLPVPRSATGRLRIAPVLTSLPSDLQYISAPLLSRRTLHGLIVAVCRPGHDVSATRRIVRACAARLTGPLDHALLQAELAAVATAIEHETNIDDTLATILRGVRSVVPADAVGLLVREGHNARIVAVDGHPPAATGLLMPIAGDLGLERTLLEGQPICLSDPQWSNVDEVPGAARIRSYLAAPLRAGSKVIGLLAADGWQPDLFGDEDMRRLTRFAAYAGAALARARQHSFSKAQMVALREAASLATHDPADGTLMARILDSLRTVITCEGASVMLTDGPHARVAAVHGHSPDTVGYRFLIAGDRSLETPLWHGQPIVLDDLSSDASFNISVTRFLIRGHIKVPLRVHGEILGTLCVDSTRASAFGPDDVAVLELFAGYVAAVLHNETMHRALHDAAHRDPVTTLFNHRAIHDTLDRELEQARLTTTPLAVAMLDLDGFKLYNDTHGHLAGDAALQAIGAALTHSCRDQDSVGRYGGDEFLVVLPGLGPDEAATVATRLRDAVAARPLQVAGGRIPLRVSVGVACYPEDGAQRDVLVACADARLYESKHRGEVVGHAAQSLSVGDVGESGVFNVLEGLVRAVDRKDHYTRAHSEEVTRLALALATELGLSAETLRAVRMGGLLHDIGKIGVPDRILKKPDRLTADELAIMNGHPALGEAIVAGLRDLTEIRTAVRSHHERWDGRGYPDGLAGDEIPLLGRLLALPDSYNAMTTDRPYRAALSPSEALAEIERGAGSQFDPHLVAAFIRVLRGDAIGLTAILLGR